jgi:hypothetical protein
MGRTFCSAGIAHCWSNTDRPNNSKGSRDEYSRSNSKADVYFGTQQTGYRKGSVVRFASDKQLIVKAPGGKVGEVVDVLVMFEPGGQLRIPNAFTYVLKGAGPSINDLDINKDKRNEK